MIDDDKFVLRSGEMMVKSFGYEFVGIEMGEGGY